MSKSIKEDEGKVGERKVECGVCSRVGQREDVVIEKGVKRLGKQKVKGAEVG